VRISRSFPAEPKSTEAWPGLSPGLAGLILLSCIEINCEIAQLVSLLVIDNFFCAESRLCRQFTDNPLATPRLCLYLSETFYQRDVSSRPRLTFGPSIRRFSRPELSSQGFEPSCLFLSLPKDLLSCTLSRSTVFELVSQPAG
jgi:hypothetical protein